jgi:arginine decarboxylase
LLAQGEYDQLRKLTAGITRTLAEDTHPTSLPAARDHEHGEQIGLWVKPAQPTFEVLVVDDMAPREEESLRQELLRLRRPEDHFSYELVVVPSFEDALIAVLLNVNLQACVLRHGFEVASGHELGAVRHFFSSIAPDKVACCR